MPQSTSIPQDMQQAQALLNAGRLDEALAAYREIIAREPGLADAHNELGVSLMRKRLTREAVDAFRTAFQLQPTHVQACNNIGIALSQLAAFDQAIAAHERAIELNPDSPVPHVNLSLLLLLKGDLLHGFAEHEWRLKVPDLRTRPQQFAQPIWAGSPLAGRRILLHPEQGFGDSIQFVRYAPLVAELGGRVVLACPRELLELFRTVQGVEQLVTHGDPLPLFDVHCPLLSLPAVMKTTLETIPASTPYLRADAARSKHWTNRLQQMPARRNIGLAWAGRSGHGLDQERSIPTESLLPLLQMPDIRWISLQKDITAPGNIAIVDWTGELKDFADTAALIDQLDAVVTVDTAVAHLAGALGKPVYLMLPFISDWRWMLDRADSPWYSTMQLIRQQSPNDWDFAIRQVMELI